MTLAEWYNIGRAEVKRYLEIKYLETIVHRLKTQIINQRPS